MQSKQSLFPKAMSNTQEQLHEEQFTECTPEESEDKAVTWQNTFPRIGTSEQRTLKQHRDMVGRASLRYRFAKQNN